MSKSLVLAILDLFMQSLGIEFSSEFSPNFPKLVKILFVDIPKYLITDIVWGRFAVRLGLRGKQELLGPSTGVESETTEDSEEMERDVSGWFVMTRIREQYVQL
jgi:hypothetical protein